MRTQARIDLGAVRDNVAALAARAAGGAQVMAVVKADGYGHGLLPCARAAVQGGASWLGVAFLEEALALRSDGIDVPVLAWLMVRRTTAPLLRHFAIQTAAWGAVNLAIVAWAWRGLKFRDFAGSQSLLNVLWLNTGLDVGYAAVGVTLALAAWRWGQRPGGVGAGLGVVVQGVALALLDLRLIMMIGPLQ